MNRKYITIHHSLYLYIILAAFYLMSCSKDDSSGIEKGSGIIFGKIVDKSTNDPIPGASVTIYPGGKTTITGNNGQFEFTSLNNGSYLLQNSKKGYLATTSFTSIDQANTNVQVDTSLEKGESCLNIMLGELDFGNNSSSKTFVISNNGNKTIQWNLYSDFHDFLSFDKTKGELKSGENTAVNVNLIRGGTSSEIIFFPIYVYAEGEQLGAIATVNRSKNGAFNSMLIGTWTLYESQSWITTSQEILYNKLESENGNYLTINSDFTFRQYNRTFINNNINDVDNMFVANLIKGEITYDQANNIIQLGEYGSIYKIKNLTKDFLELETPKFQEQNEGENLLYERIH